MLFRAAKVDFGEWIYVCNSPEDASLVLCLAKQMSELYDVMITVIVLGDNAGFGAANNIAIEHAASDRIFIFNPDVYPMHSHAPLLQKGAERRRPRLNPVGRPPILRRPQPDAFGHVCDG